jgi:Flp pilus assembly pilin Flp
VCEGSQGGCGLRRFWGDESGAELVEWIVVTFILILATYALLQAVGPELRSFGEAVLERLGNILGR